MSPTEVSFPRRDLTDAQHQQVRELLVREATPAAARRRAIRPLVLVPAVAALAVAAVVVGAGVTTHDWNPITGVPAAVRGDFGDGECGIARMSTPKKATGLRYLAPVPAGWLDESWLNVEPYCRTFGGPDPVPVTAFVKQNAADGQVTTALTVWRSLPPGVDEGWAVATSTDLKPGKEQPANGESVAATVHHRPARLLGLNVLTWTEPDGQRWSLTSAGTTPSELVALAEGLSFEGGEVAAPKGFTQYPIQTLPTLKENSLQGTWYQCAGPDNSSECQFQVEANRTAEPWQVTLTKVGLPARIVEVSGRPGVLRPDPDLPGTALLATDTADGVQLRVEGSVPAPSDLVQLAGTLQLVGADDPRIHKP